MSTLPFSQELIQEFSNGMSWSEKIQVGIVLRGSLRIRCANRVRDFSVHDLFFYFPFETVSFISHSENTAVFLLKINTDFIADFCPDIRNISLHQHHLTHDMTNETYLSMCRAFSTIIFQDLKMGLCSDMKILSAVTELITVIIEEYGTLNAQKAPRDYASERIMTILAYMNSHYTENISVKDLAAELGLHPQYFSTFFRETFGVRFVEYLTAFRINSSLSDLLHTEHSIMEIALDHGFNSHKTYAAAFRKQFGCTPREYRQQVLSSSAPTLGEALSGIDSKSDLSLFSFFSQFRKTAGEPASGIASKSPYTLEFTPAEMRSIAVLNNRLAFSAGRAQACLRSNLQELIRKARRDIHISHLRVRDIFSDDLYIYHKEEGQAPLYNWTSLDLIFDHLLSEGIAPILEIGYMPEALASRKQYSHFQYHPNVSLPKSMPLWQDLIRSFLTHYQDRYGKEALRTWYFDFWVAPDLKIRSPYWYGTQQEFFRFYESTYRVFREIDPGLLLGTPNFSTLTGFPWYESFFDFCLKNNIQPDYLSAHLYGMSEDLNDPVSPPGKESHPFFLSSPDTVTDNLKRLKKIAAEKGFSELPVIVSDWNFSFLPTDLIRETSFLGPWLCYNYANTIGLAEILSFRSLSDFYEEAFPDSTLFSGKSGALGYNGIRKASYNTLTLLSRLGKRLLAKGDYYILTEGDNSWQLILFNLAKFDETYTSVDNTLIDRTHRYNIYRNTSPRLIHLALHIPKGTYLIKKHEVNRNAGSAYDIWEQIGFPEVIPPDLLEYMEKSSQPRLSCFVQKVERTLLLEETVPVHGVMLLEIERT